MVKRGEHVINPPIDILKWANVFLQPFKVVLRKLEDGKSTSDSHDLPLMCLGDGDGKVEISLLAP